MPMIPYGHQDISEADIEAVADVLRSDWLTQGPAIKRFEHQVADYCGAEHAVAVCNATAALHLACRVIDLGPGDILWTSPITFVASANCAQYCGAEVDFVDIDSRTSNLCPRALARKLVGAERAGRLPKAVIPVHFAGQSCDMARIKDLSDHYGFHIIEDASHAIGASYHDRKVGSCAYSDMTVFSFHPVKIITTGEGGMILTRSQELYDKLQLLRSHGITRDPRRMCGEAEGSWYYQQIDLGYNYRMTDIQAALGVSQLRRLDEFVARRHYLAKRYQTKLQDLPVTLPWQHLGEYSAWHLYVVRLECDKINKSRCQVVKAMQGAGIGVNVHYIPVHTQPYYQKLGFRLGDFPEAERHYSEAITLPLYPGLTDEDQDKVIEALRDVLA